MRRIFFLAALSLQLLPALATRFEYGKDVVINQPVFEDIYLAGGTITINARIHGDLVVAGGTIIINDTVDNDILVAGGNITLNGFVGDDIRCAGGSIRISRNVDGDVVITGGTITIDRQVTIGNLMTGGGNIIVDGTVNGDIRGAFGELTLNGTVLKNVDCHGGKITVNGTVQGMSVLAANVILIGDNAAFHNDVRYWSKRHLVVFGQSLKNVKAVYDPSLRVKTGQWYYLGAATVLGLLWYLGMALLMILVLQYLFSTTMKKAADTVYNQAGRSFLFGLLFAIGTPIAALVAFVTVVGVPIGLLLLAGYIFAIILASVITALVGANWVNNRYQKNWNGWQMSFAAFGIFILLKLAFSIPFAGWIFMLLFVCASFGGILLNINWRKRPALSAAAS